MVPCPVIGYPHRFPPVCGSKARRKNLPGSLEIDSAPVPAKFFIGSGSLADDVYGSHCSSVATYSSSVCGLYDGDIQLEAPRTDGHTRFPLGVGSLSGAGLGLPRASMPLVQCSDWT